MIGALPSCKKENEENSNASDVKVLFVKNHAFQTVTKNAQDFTILSKVNIDAKYQGYYDNGLVMAYIKNSKDANAIWDANAIFSASPNDWYAYVNVTRKDHIELGGYVYANQSNVTEADIKAARVDIKIVFIPAGSVETMVQQHVNPKDANQVARFLSLQ